MSMDDRLTSTPFSRSMLAMISVDGWRWSWARLIRSTVTGAVSTLSSWRDAETTTSPPVRTWGVSVTWRSLVGPATGTRCVS